MTDHAKNRPLFIKKGRDTLLLEPASGRYVPTKDVQEKFADLSKKSARNIDFEQAFLLSKIQTLKKQTHLAESYRNAAVSRLQSFLQEGYKCEPTGSRVGYGFFYYQDSFRTAFDTGTVIALDFIAPTQTGGNICNYLYLTATNRASKGVEALVYYSPQEDMRFRVFDPARIVNNNHDSGWQTNINITYNDLGDYLTKKTAHGNSYQVLSIQNQTSESQNGNWTNTVWLYNYRNNTYDQIYRFEYPCSKIEQKVYDPSGYGWWGPIVEVFQESCSNTNHLGFLQTHLSACDESGQWTEWETLLPTQSYLATKASVGFQEVFVEPNHSFAVH
ncbi:conserved hypothetical protein [Candidatus Brocadia pituitae]|nr:conserved hypothetical protein [Candidatus Brocadia pituitae]